jgi:hypothetical protein
MSIRTYQELLSIDTFHDRLEYLMLRGAVGSETFGGLRHINQQFYASSSWKSVRDYVIARDRGWDLAYPHRVVQGTIFVHHMNPITESTLMHDIDLALDPMYLITVSFKTHQIIHFSYNIPEDIEPIERSPGDTRLW